jgi:subtilisin family serine protease
VAPDAQVRAIRVMYSDGLVVESALVTALRYLAARIRYAQEQARAGQPVDPADLVDVVNLSLGGFFETAAAEQQDSPLLDAVNDLACLGVVVVAAAGNHATTRRFYPAALAGQPTRPHAAPVVSVGALNPNGTKASFSDDGSWVNCWASGVAVVSTMPTSVRGERNPALLTDRPGPPGEYLPERRETFDLDDYVGGLGLWSGTSFATPLVAAAIARNLLVASAGELSLDDPSTEARLRRARHAVDSLPK